MEDIHYVILAICFVVIMFLFWHNAYEFSFNKNAFVKRYNITDMYYDGCHYGKNYTRCDGDNP